MMGRIVEIEIGRLEQDICVCTQPWTMHPPPTRLKSCWRITRKHGLLEFTMHAAGHKGIAVSIA